MAHTDSLPPDQLERVASEIAGFFGNESEVGDAMQPVNHVAAEAEAAAGESSLEIGLTLAIWVPKTTFFESLKSGTVMGDLSYWLEPTPFAYHQIRAQRGAVGFARSYARETANNKCVFHLNFSAIASRIHEAFDLIDRNGDNDPIAAGDPVVRLLEIPACHIISLWLFAEASNESRVVLIDAPKRYREQNEPAFLNSQAFFAVLQQAGPISGVA
jgi:hypothetical protein